MKKVFRATALCLIMAPGFSMAAATCGVVLSPGSPNLGRYMCGADTLKAAQDACGEDGYKSCDESINVCVCNGKPSIAPVGVRPLNLKGNTPAELPATKKTAPPTR